MTRRNTFQYIAILLPFLLVFLWEAAGLDSLTVPVIGVLVITALLATRSKRKVDPNSQKSGIEKYQDELSIFIAITLVLLLIFSTGDLTSPLFFLLYFLAFAIALTLTPITVFVYTLGVFLLFLPLAFSPFSFEDVLRVGSIFLITPLAFFFGKEMKERESERIHNAEIAETIQKEAEDVLTSKEDTLSPQEQSELVDIMKKSEELKS